MKKGTLRQILLITDGCSNQGEDPVAMAALAREHGMTVNVIGVLDENERTDSGLKEIENIALSGGGIHQLVYARQLSHTVQMVTRKAMTQTIQGFIHKELQSILGAEKEIEDLPPDKRGQVVEVVDELGETMDLEVLIMIDTSASMQHKLPTVEDALLDLSISLHSRIGQNEYALYAFPGKRKQVEQLMNWTPQMKDIHTIFPKLSSGGITPTGPALKEAIEAYQKKRSKRGLLEDGGYFEESGS
ncbi:VWA domain-containing protein [Bacillus sp. NTK071]|uniref:VWA domain-containing protein n=1 Tax=Guptibacillus hwajinpoensis TaxID=208199 RepID=A0A4U1M948_9BACL|nr:MULTISPECIES: VWA domain-containing protein [Bacillaceae]MBN8211055.1 VWA domain-containing protein [Bacillus sp. NTK071]TKD66941.1 VWA domain-containing protein [Pseudalkalibacillus hwajinpoensis]